MKIIENGLIPIMENESGEHLVDAKELHEFLIIGRDFTTWVKDKLDKYGFVENEDFILTFTKTGERKNVTKHEYILTLDTAKEIAMLENNEKGREVRKYFIAVEKKTRQKQLESIEHFHKEQMMLGFVINTLNVNDGSKVKMIKKFNTAHKLTTEYLPDYTDENITKALSTLLKEHNYSMSAVKMNALLIQVGILTEAERPSSKGTKKFKVLTEKGLKYGKNLINTSGNQKETQPHYYEDTFLELINLVTSI